MVPVSLLSPRGPERPSLHRVGRDPQDSSRPWVANSPVRPPQSRSQEEFMEGVMCLSPGKHPSFKNSVLSYETRGREGPPVGHVPTTSRPPVPDPGHSPRVRTLVVVSSTAEGRHGGLSQNPIPGCGSRRDVFAGASRVTRHSNVRPTLTFPCPRPDRGRARTGGGEAGRAWTQRGVSTGTVSRASPGTCSRRTTCRGSPTHSS